MRTCAVRVRRPALCRARHAHRLVCRRHTRPSFRPSCEYERPSLLASVSCDRPRMFLHYPAGAQALQALHHRLLPFVLRRLKCDVLQDLPPKVIQDVLCDLTPAQVTLYAGVTQLPQWCKLRDALLADDRGSDGAASTAPPVATSARSAGARKRARLHTPQRAAVDDVPVTQCAFSSLQHLRQICNHPALVARDGTGYTARDSCKLIALRCVSQELRPQHPSLDVCAVRCVSSSPWFSQPRSWLVLFFAVGRSTQATAD